MSDDAYIYDKLFMIFKLVNNTYRFFYNLNLLQNLLNLYDDINQIKSCHYVFRQVLIYNIVLPAYHVLSFRTFSVRTSVSPLNQTLRKKIY